MASRKLSLPASYELALSASHKYVAALGRNVALADLRGRKRLASWHPLSHPSHATFAHSESLLAVKGTSGEIVVLNIPDGSVVGHHVSKHSDEGAALYFSADDEFLVEGSWDGHIRVRRTRDLQVAAEFSFPGEMITEVSPSADRQNWLFAHQPKTNEGKTPPHTPYLTLWSWPLERPYAKLPSGFDNLYAVALSPCSSYIATVGRSWETMNAECRVASLAGSTLAVKPATIGGTGIRTRWSPDSTMVGIVDANGFSIFDAPTLDLFNTFGAKYPADLAFLENNTSILLGTWESGAILALRTGNA